MSQATRYPLPPYPSIHWRQHGTLIPRTRGPGYTALLRTLPLTGGNTTLDTTLLPLLHSRDWRLRVYRCSADGSTGLIDSEQTDTAGGYLQRFSAHCPIVSCSLCRASTKIPYNTPSLPTLPYTGGNTSPHTTLSVSFLNLLWWVVVVLLVEMAL